MHVYWNTVYYILYSFLLYINTTCKWYWLWLVYVHIFKIATIQWTKAAEMPSTVCATLLVIASCHAITFIYIYIYIWNRWFSCYQLEVTGLGTLATFRPDALIFFRAKVTEHLVETSARFLTLLLQAGHTRTIDFMSKPAEKLSLHSYLSEHYGSSTQKLVREYERCLHIYIRIAYGRNTLFCPVQSALALVLFHFIPWAVILQCVTGTVQGQQARRTKLEKEVWWAQERTGVVAYQRLLPRS